MAPAFQAVAPPQNGHVATAAMAAARLVARVQHRIDRPIRVVERDTLTFVRGLPEVEDGTLTVAINAVPGSGPLPARDSWPTARIDEVTRELTTYVASVPPADVPAGMAPLTVNHVLVGCYDDRLMALFVDHVAIAAFAIPAWLQNFERPAETLVDPDSAAQALARAARQNAGDTGQAVARTREDVANRRTQLEDLRQEIAAYEAELARQPAPDPMAALEEQLHRIQAAGVWSPVSDINRDLRFQLSHREVVDPRDGRRRRLPHTLDVSLRGWCVGLGPFAQHRNTTTNPDQHHPRIFGGHLLQPELEQAVQEAARNGDFEGGLALIHDVLTNFTADDPDVAALDGWPVV